MRHTRCKARRSAIRCRPRACLLPYGPRSSQSSKPIIETIIETNHRNQSSKPIIETNIETNHPNYPLQGTLTFLTPVPTFAGHAASKCRERGARLRAYQPATLPPVHPPATKAACRGIPRQMRRGCMRKKSALNQRQISTLIRAHRHLGRQRARADHGWQFPKKLLQVFRMFPRQRRFGAEARGRASGSSDFLLPRALPARMAELHTDSLAHGDANPIASPPAGIRPGLYWRDFLMCACTPSICGRAARTPIHHGPQQ